MFQQRCSFALRKIVLVDFQFKLFCLKNDDIRCFVFMILFQQLLHIRQIMFKYSTIFAEKKALSANEIIKFFSFSFVLKNVFYFLFFVFVYKNHFTQRDNV